MKFLCGGLSCPVLHIPNYLGRSCIMTLFTDARNTRSYLSKNNGTQLGCRRYCVGPNASNKMELIKELREKTSAPIKDVKSSLVGCNWDIEAARRDLRKRGVIVASRKFSRTATEGLIAMAETMGRTSVIELNCETDFVARNELFQYLASSLAKLALTTGGSHQKIYEVPPGLIQDLVMKLDHPKLSSEMTAHSAILELTAIMGEHIRYRRGYIIPAGHGMIFPYLHTCPAPCLGRICGIISLEFQSDHHTLSTTASDALRRVGSELAMHVVAARPLFLSTHHVSPQALHTEREILQSQAEVTGKSKMAVEKIVEGRLRKYIEDVVLMEQKFVVNDTLRVRGVLSDLSKELGSQVNIADFLRIEVGEGAE